MTISAGIIYYRITEGGLEVFLAHSTGHKNIYSFPKGEVDENETIFEGAIREFYEETEVPVKSTNILDYFYLGSIRQSKTKIVHAFAIEADIDEEICTSNWCEFPEGTGKYIPEIDDYHWFSIQEAYQVINPKQIPLLDTLVNLAF